MLRRDTQRCASAERPRRGYPPLLLAKLHNHNSMKLWEIRQHPHAGCGRVHYYPGDLPGCGVGHWPKDSNTDSRKFAHRWKKPTIKQKSTTKSIMPINIKRVRHSFLFLITSSSVLGIAGKGGEAEITYPIVIAIR